MRRREFMQQAGGALAVAALARSGWSHEAGACESECSGATYATVKDAIAAPRETLLYATALYVGTDVKQPDYLATIDVDPASANYSKVVSRAVMPNVGDELHHFGWNACSSCHADPSKSRRFIVLPGLYSSRIHILDATDPAQPKLHKVIEPDEIAKKTDLSAPHTVHCLPSGEIMISMLGDAKGDAPGGFLLLNQEFEIVGRWEKPSDKDKKSLFGPMKFNYDFWYQPRHDVMLSSEWAAPKTFQKGFSLDEVKAGKFGSQLNFWDWKTHEQVQSIDLGAEGLIPLEVRFHHDPDSAHAFVGAALSSSMWHVWKNAEEKPGQQWKADKVIQIEPVETKGWPFPVPGLITDLVLSLDDRWLYFSNWLHGDIRQYDVSNPAKPRLAGQLWLGGVIGKPSQAKRDVTGGPQMLQLSLDGRRLYVTNSLYSSWDNQFYPTMAKSGSYLMQIDCDTDKGGLALNEKFFVDFGKEPGGAARAHEMRFPGGDSTSDIWV